MHSRALSPVIIGLWMGLSVGSGAAQTIVPAQKRITSFSDVFSLRVRPGNTERRAVDMVVRVYDAKLRLVRARVTPRRFRLGGSRFRSVLVTVPFEGKRKRTILVCAERTKGEGAGRGFKIRTRVCGRYSARRL